MHDGQSITQWDREILKIKKKDMAMTKVTARMPPSGARKPRRGGWCECCERQYIGTMSEVSGNGVLEELFRASDKTLKGAVKRRLVCVRNA